MLLNLHFYYCEQHESGQKRWFWAMSVMSGKSLHLNHLNDRPIFKVYFFSIPRESCKYSLLTSAAWDDLYFDEAQPVLKFGATARKNSKINPNIKNLMPIRGIHGFTFLKWVVGESWSQISFL